MNKRTKSRKKLKEDLEFARRTEEAYKSYERGEFKSMDYEKFLKLLKRL